MLRGVPEARLTADEAAALGAALHALAVRTRTSEVGLVHGLDRFVSGRVILKRREIDLLDAAARKLGLSGIKRVGE
jgi:hypothetical protein